MRVLLAVLAGTVLAACELPSRVAPPVRFDYQRVSHVGDAFKILPAKDPAEGPIEVKLTNQENGSTRSLVLDQAGGTISLDRDGLPGFQQDAKVQTFEIWATVQGDRFGNYVSVVKDPTAQLFPTVGIGRGCPVAPNGPAALPPEPRCWASGDSTAGPELFVSDLVTNLKLDAPTITHRTIDRQDVKLPGYLREAPASTKFVRYDVAATFPTYLVPAEYSSSGKDDVYAPISLAIVLTQTDPAELVSLMAL